MSAAAAAGSSGSAPLLAVALFAAQLGATLALVGVIWQTQLVQYPSFAAVDRNAFAAHHRRYVRRITAIVAPLMTIELVTAAALIILPPAGVPAVAAWTGALLVAAVWLSTALIQVPLHDRLAAGFDERTHAALVRGNWLRTAAWSARGLLLLALAAALLAGERLPAAAGP